MESAYWLAVLLGFMCAMFAMRAGSALALWPREDWPLIYFELGRFGAALPGISMTMGWLGFFGSLAWGFHFLDWYRVLFLGLVGYFGTPFIDIVLRRLFPIRYMERFLLPFGSIFGTVFVVASQVLLWRIA